MTFEQNGATVVLGAIVSIRLRPATLADAATFESWDFEPHVISATTDDKDAEKAYGDHDWRVELPKQSAVSQYYMAELDGRPIGGMQIIDPYLEPTHYWGDVAPNLRAIDIWIGKAEDLGKGYGEQMMKLSFEICFKDPAVTAILIDPLRSNNRAHKFYQRLGFKVVGQRMFGPDDCLVHELTRKDWQKMWGLR